MIKKIYEAPQVEVIPLDDSDVLTSSTEALLKWDWETGEAQ